MINAKARPIYPCGEWYEMQCFECMESPGRAITNEAGIDVTR